jgi:hypothetical protein
MDDDVMSQFVFQLAVVVGRRPLCREDLAVYRRYLFQVLPDHSAHGVCHVAILAYFLNAVSRLLAYIIDCSGPLLSVLVQEDEGDFTELGHIVFAYLDDIIR